MCYVSKCQFYAIWDCLELFGVTSSNNVTTLRSFQRRKSFLFWPGTIESNLIHIQKVVPDWQALKDCLLFYYIVAY